MKKILFMLAAISFFCACHKKMVAPDFSDLIVGKWVCNSYKKDDSDTIIRRSPYSLSGYYERGWEFFTNNKIGYKSGNGPWSIKPAENDYFEIEGKNLLINTVQSGSSSLYTYEIIELNASALTVHSKVWDATFFLTPE